LHDLPTFTWIKIRNRICELGHLVLSFVFLSVFAISTAHIKVSSGSFWVVPCKLLENITMLLSNQIMTDNRGQKRATETKDNLILVCCLRCLDSHPKDEDIKRPQNL
jgi:hypothetical protein